MPVLGLFAIGRFFFRILAALWRREEVRGLFLVALITILAGAWVYLRFEPSITNWVDAFYFTVITLTTIGYGDFSPTTPFTKLFTTMYVFIGLGFIAGLIGLVGETMIENTSKFREERKSRKEASD